MIKFKEKIFFWGGAIMAGTTGLSLAQGHSQGVQAEEAAEEQAKLQRKMNTQLKRIADSADPTAGQQAASVLQGQTAFSMSEDVGNDLDKGIKKAGNAVGGSVGTVAGGLTGGALGTAVGAGIGARGGGGWKGAGKGSLIGAAAGVIGGSILGGASGSSMFSDTRVGSVLDFRQKRFAVASELGKAAKGLWNVAGKHKTTLAEGLGMGAIAAGTGYMANKAIKSGEEKEQNGDKSGMGTGTKLALGIGGALATGMALKSGAKLGMLGKKAATYGSGTNKAINKGANALMMGTGFGAGMAALPYAMQNGMQQEMDENGNPKGMSTGKKVALGIAGVGAGLAGAKFAAGKGWLGSTAKTMNRDFNIKVKHAKNDFVKNVFGEEALKNKQAFEKAKTMEEGRKNLANSVLSDAEKAAGGADKVTSQHIQDAINAKSKTAKGNPINTDFLKIGADGKSISYGAGDEAVAHLNPTFSNSPVHRTLDFVGAAAGGGTQKTQRLANQLLETDSKYLQKAGQFMKDNRKTALVAAAPLGYGAMMGTWDIGEKATNKVLGVKPEEDENI